MIITDGEREPDETQARPEPPGVPAWVRISGAIVALLILVVILVLIVSGGGGGEHGPGRHGAEGSATPAATTVGALG